MTILVAGQGRVGSALTAALRAVQLDVSTWSRSVAARGFACDVVIVSVRDDAIAEVAERLAGEGYVTPSTVLLHCAGALPAEEVFARARGNVRGVGLLHPLRALAGEASDHDFRGTVFAVQGDAEGLATATDLVQRIGGRPLHLDGAGLARYHAAAAIVGNHALSLVETAIGILVGEGLDRHAATSALAELLASAARNVEARGLPDALTGPISRGDVAVVARHLAALSGPARSIYRNSALPTVALARRAGRVSAEHLDAIEALLSPQHD